MDLLFSESSVYVLGLFAPGDRVSSSLQSVHTLYNEAINPDVCRTGPELSTFPASRPHPQVCPSWWHCQGWRAEQGARGSATMGYSACSEFKNKKPN